MLKKRIAVTGSHGLVGTTLCSFLSQQGYDIVRIVQGDTSISNTQAIIYWNIRKGQLDVESLENLDAVIHLAGANIAAKRWTPEYKKEIRESRLQGTLLLSERLAQLRNPPKVLLSASAVGFYGHQPSQTEISERAPKGKGFLATLCDDWETSTWPAKQKGIRIVRMRFGMVLSEKGGALAKMLPVFRSGFGGKIASGDQMISWVALEEIPFIVLHLLENLSLSGAVNVVSPNPVSNKEFTSLLGEVLKKPTIFPLPGFAAKLMFGEMADDLLLNGARVTPEQLKNSKYKFAFPLLKTTLSHILTKV